MFYTLHLTDMCNMRCDYCYQSRTPRRMSDETAFAAVDLASQGTAKPGIVFFGGEPLTEIDLIRRIVAYARRREKEKDIHYSFKITTNALALDGDTLAFLTRENISVAISLDGTREAHDAHRKDAGGGGTYARVSDAARRILALRPYTPALMTVNPDTLKYYADGVRELYEAGFEYVVCSMNYAADWDDGDIPLLRGQYEKLAELYYEKTKAEHKFYLTPFETKISSHIHSRTYCRERCELGLKQISIDTDGKFYPCVQFVGKTEFLIGDIENGIDQTARRQIYLRNETEKPTCSNCAIRERCNHFCGCLNMQSTGSVDRVSPFQCAHERTLLPIADKLAKRLFREHSGMFIQKQYNEFYPLISYVEDTSGTKQK